MAENITTVGAEFLIKVLITEEATKPTNTTIGLFDNQTESTSLYTVDSGDVTITESTDVGDITTEPSDGNYARLSYAFGTTDFSSTTNANGNWQANFSEKTFDVANTTGYADSYFEVVSFTAGGESSANDHLLTFGPLLDSQGNQMRIDLGSATSFDFSGSLIVP
ncbi:hypothetical protein [Halocatena halophila]|uniref:hypothetical protein n=1 Tax=Halocatena halophila TaxID=2814576 RepID=UPI002ED3C9FB